MNWTRGTFRSTGRETSLVIFLLLLSHSIRRGRTDTKWIKYSMRFNTEPRVWKTYQCWGHLYHLYHLQHYSCNNNTDLRSVLRIYSSSKTCKYNPVRSRELKQRNGLKICSLFWHVRVFPVDCPHHYSPSLSLLTRKCPSQVTNVKNIKLFWKTPNIQLIYLYRVSTQLPPYHPPSTIFLVMWSSLSVSENHIHCLTTELEPVPTINLSGDTSVRSSKILVLSV